MVPLFRAIVKFCSTNRLFIYIYIYITEIENEALKFGLSHSSFPPYLKTTDIFSCFESFFQSMTSHLINKKDENSLNVELFNLAHLYVNSFKSSPKDIETHKVFEKSPQMR